MKTIRQIADELGVSKQAVYKRFKGKLHTVCAPYAHTEQGVLYLEEQGETLDLMCAGGHPVSDWYGAAGAVFHQ